MPEDKQEMQWIEAYRQGDIQALGLLVEHYRKPLFGFIYKMVNNTQDAEEIFQEVWLRAVKNLRSFKGGSFLSWLFRITHNHIIDRSRKKRPVVSMQQHGDDQLSLEDKVESPGFNAAEMSADADLGQKIRAAVSQLPKKQKAVFLMRTEGDLSFKEIAEIQKISINTALAQMQYALQKLRDELQDDYSNLQRSS